VTPLVLLLLLAFLMVIAASLMIWAALTVGDERGRALRAGTTDGDATSRSVTAPTSARTARRTSTRSGANAERPPERVGQHPVTGPRQDDAAMVPPRPSNDEVRGARAVVTPRTHSDDAFERFLESETKDRGFPPARPDDRRDR
jgi:hypothetical protein